MAFYLEVSSVTFESNEQKLIENHVHPESKLLPRNLVTTTGALNMKGK